MLILIYVLGLFFKKRNNGKGGNAGHRFLMGQQILQH